MAADFTKAEIEAKKKELLAMGFVENPDGTLSPVGKSTSKMDESLKKASDEYNKQIIAKGKADNSIAKADGIGNTALNAAAGVLGLGQAIGGAKILKNTKAPKYPYELLPNQQLSARLGDVQRLSQIGDPLIREKMLRDMALNNAKLDAVAKVSSGGDISSYAAQSQANATGQNDAIRNIGLSELDFKMKQGGLLDGLIAQKRAEDMAIQRGRVEKFTNVDMPEYQARRGYGENLVNKGIGNLFNAGIGASQGATVLKRTGQNDALFKKQESDLAGLPSQEAMVSPTVPITQTLPNVNLNLSGILPTAYQTMNGKNPVGIGVMQGFKSGDGSILGLGQAPPPAPIEYVMPADYDAYKGKVSKLTDEQILSGFNGRLNPLTRLPYNYTVKDIAKIRTGMTDGIYGDKHRVAQDLINKLGL